jgi:hypothetical protein
LPLRRRRRRRLLLLGGDRGLGRDRRRLLLLLRLPLLGHGFFRFLLGVCGGVFLCVWGRRGEER